MKRKITLLRHLNENLSKPREWPGLFLPIGSTERDDVMFVAEMPSMIEPKKEYVNFNASARDRFFVQTLKDYGVTGVYVTDIVKRRDAPRRPSEKEINEWLGFLLKEINIINPKLLIIIGKKNYDKNYIPYIKAYIPKNMCDDWIYHYCSQVTRHKFTRRFVEVIDKHKNLLNIAI